MKCNEKLKPDGKGMINLLTTMLFVSASEQQISQRTDTKEGRVRRNIQ